MGLASCLWLARTVPYFVMASGHELTFNAIVMNIVNISSPIDLRTRTARFLYTTKLGEMSLSVAMELE